MSEQAASPLVGTGARPPRPRDEPGVEGPDLVARAVRRFQAGDDPEAAFRVIYETFFPPLVRFFLRKRVESEDAFDLTQETLIGIYKGLKGYEDRQRFAAWVYRVATTTFLKHLRRAGTAKRAAIEVSRDAMENPEPTAVTPADQLDGLVADERRRALRTAVASLPDQMRDCLVLRLYHQLAYREIAVIKKLSVETVKAHLFRARKKLEEELGAGALGTLEEE